MSDFSRRTLIAAGSAAGGLVLSGPWFGAAAARKTTARAGAPRLIRSSDFRLAIRGLSNNIAGLRKVSGGKLTMGINVNPRSAPGSQLSYGEPIWSDIQLTVQTGPGMTKLQEWADKAMKTGGGGSALRRDCSLYLLARDKSSVLRTINYFGCYPINMNAGDQSTGSDVKSITFTCNVDRIEETKG